MQSHRKTTARDLLYVDGYSAPELNDEEHDPETAALPCSPAQIIAHHESRRLLYPSRAFSAVAIIILAALLLFDVAPISPNVAAASAPPVSKKVGQAQTLLAGLAQNGVAELRQGDAVKLEIAGGETRSFGVALAAGQSAKLVVVWQGIDLDVAAFKPDGQRLSEFDAQVVAPGPVSVSVIAEQAGSYRFELRPSKELKMRGSFEIKLEAVRPGTAEDESRLAAERALAEAQHQKSKEAAVSKYEQALRFWRESGDTSGEANTLSSLARMYQTERALPEAESSYKMALAVRQKMNDRRGEAYTIIELGSAFEELSSPEKALDYYTQALRAFREVADRRGEATASYSVGFAYALTGKMRESLKFYNDALSIQRAEKDRLAEARTLNSLGGAYSTLGDSDQALILYQQAAPVWQELNDRYREAITINNIGLIYDDWGDWQKARDNYDAALLILKSLLKNGWDNCGAQTGTQELRTCNVAASVLDNIGELYSSLGDPQSALLKFQESLPIRQSLKQPRGQGSTLSRICYAIFLQDKPQEALGYCEQALPFHKTAGDLRRQAFTFTIMGMIYTALNEQPKALAYYKQALQLQEDAGERRVQAITLDKMGDVYALAGDTKNAFDSYERALRLWREVKDQDGEAITLYNIARAERARDHFSEARKLVEQAIGITESLRVNVTGQRLRSSYFARKLNFYELDIDLKMQLSKADNNSASLVAAALESNERARARSLLDVFVEGRIDTSRTGNQALKELLTSRLSLQRRLNARAMMQTSLLNAEHTDEQAAAIAGEIARVTTEYDEIETQIGRNSPRYAALTRPPVLSLKEIQEKLLDADTLLLEYALGAERSYLWVVSATEIKGYQLAKRAEIEESARRFKKILAARQRLPSETSQQYQARLLEAEAQYGAEAVALGKMLLGAAVQELGKKRLLVVAEGELQSLPFGALMKPSAISPGQESAQTTATADFSRATPLVVDHEIIGLPSASTLALIRSDESARQRPPKTVAVLADPVFEKDDPRLQLARRTKTPGASPVTISKPLEEVLRDFGTSLPRLLSSRREARDIMAAAPAGTAMQALDFKASRAMAVNPILSQYRIVHFATHGILNDEYPELSGIVLSLFDERGRLQEDGFLRLNDVYNLNLPVELVVLSACQTGLGKNIRGEGLIGLTRGFIYAGASRVVASLWKVDDEATAELMKRFYEYMLKDGLPPAAALRQAQLSMREQKRWRAPYFWAGFILQGEWK
jgi:CHAT domain-containing protein